VKIGIGVAAASILQHAVPMRSILIDQAAQMLKVSRRTIYNRIRDGQLETVRTVGGSQRVLLDSIEALLPRSDPFRVPAAGVSGTTPSGKYPAP
jgi:excisionase family DNA binding protein